MTEFSEGRAGVFLSQAYFYILRIKTTIRKEIQINAWNCCTQKPGEWRVIDRENTNSYKKKPLLSWMCFKNRTEFFGTIGRIARCFADQTDLKRDEIASLNKRKKQVRRGSPKTENDISVGQQNRLHGN